MGIYRYLLFDFSGNRIVCKFIYLASNIILLVFLCEKVGDNIKIGELRDIITLQRQNRQNSTVINLDAKYEGYKTIWAKVEYFSSKEIYSASAVNILDSVKFIIRYRKDLKHDMRIKFNNEIYEIKGIRPLDNKKMYMMIVGEVLKHE